MTREEAKQAMSEGKKVTHPYFNKGDYAFMFWELDSKDIYIKNNHGCSFLRHKNNIEFDDGWELYKD